MERPASRPAVDGRRLAGRRGSALEPTSAVLVLDPEGMPEAGELRAFPRRVPPAPRADGVALSGRTVAVYYPAGRAPCRAARLTISTASAWSPMSAPGTIFATPGRRARRARFWCAHCGRIPTDTWRVLDRGISIPVSLALTRTAITPNAVTAAQIAGGAAGRRAPRRPGLRAAIAAPCCSGARAFSTAAMVRSRASSSSRRRGGRGSTPSLTTSSTSQCSWPCHPSAPSHADATVIPAGARAAGRGCCSAWRPCGGCSCASRHHTAAPVALVYERIASRDFIYVLLALALGAPDWSGSCGPRAGGSHVLLGHAVGALEASAMKRFTAGGRDIRHGRLRRAALAARPPRVGALLAATGWGRVDPRQEAVAHVLNALGWKWASDPGRPQPCARAPRRLRVAETRSTT